MTDAPAPTDLARIAAALERLSPPPPPAADPLAHPAYVWREGVLVAARAFRPLVARSADRRSRRRSPRSWRMPAVSPIGLPAHDVLLWGARGTGKSSLVKSVVGALQAE